MVEYSNADSKVVFGPVAAVIGRNGLAHPGVKREGDGKTPSGRFPLGPAFGYPPSIDTTMPYRRITGTDFWVDDPDSDDYNRWVTARPLSGSFEVLLRPDGLYEFGIVIGYNTDPIIKGLGSAIFIHVRPEIGLPTAGCVGISRPDIIDLLRLLDPAADPVIHLSGTPFQV